MATTFHLFSFLPWELRARIWELTVEPRTVEVHTISPPQVYAGGRQPYYRLVSTTPVPAPLHTCREARSLGLYQKAFSEVEHVPEDSEKRYIWLNLDIDMIDFGREDLRKYDLVAKSVRRLKVKYSTSVFISRGHFTNLEEVHIDYIGDWISYPGDWISYPDLLDSSYCYLPLDKRNILFIESKDGRTTSVRELWDLYYDSEQELFDDYYDPEDYEPEYYEPEY